MVNKKRGTEHKENGNTTKMGQQRTGTQRKRGSQQKTGHRKENVKNGRQKTGK